MISLYDVSSSIKLFSECSSVGKLGDIRYEEIFLCSAGGEITPTVFQCCDVQTVVLVDQLCMCMPGKSHFSPKKVLNVDIAKLLSEAFINASILLSLCC